MEFTAEQYDEIFLYLRSKGLIVEPYGVPPKLDTVNEAIWQMTTWNPPAGWDHLTEPDLEASPKPTWNTLLETHYALDGNNDRVLMRVRAECRRRIIAAYGGDSFEDEIELRLRSGQTAEQDAERERLRAVYRAQEIAIRAMTNAQRAEYDPTDDAIWRAPIS